MPKTSRIRRPRRTAVALLLTVALVHVSGCSAGNYSLPGHQSDPHEHIHLAVREGGLRTPTCGELFITQMIPHHQQALVMSRAELAHGNDPRVRRWAEIILVSQRREIAWMSEWSEASAAGGTSSEHWRHDMVGMRGMAGMLPPADLDRLTHARGSRLDRLFLAAMIRHHWGAIRMADRVLRAGAPVHVTTLARDIALAQRVEIQDMARLALILRTGRRISVHDFAVRTSRRPLQDPLGAVTEPACSGSTAS